MTDTNKKRDKKKHMGVEFFPNSLPLKNDLFKSQPLVYYFCFSNLFS